ncbi:MAG: zinc ribbon domain-containing protein [Patescibacteria group bacterium]
MLENLPDFGSVLPAAYENLKNLLGTDSPIDMAARVAGAYLVAVWLASVIWTVRDITDRTGNLVIQTFSVLLVVVFTPILGLPLYLLIRPRTTLAERYYEEAGLAESEYVSACPNCDAEVGEEFRFCPSCGHELLEECPDCGAPKDKDWKFCASCGSDGKTKTAPVAQEKKPEPKKAAKAEKPAKKAEEEKPVEKEREEEPVAKTETAPAEPVKPTPITVITVEDIPEAGK